MLIDRQGNFFRGRLKIKSLLRIWPGLVLILLPLCCTNSGQRLQPLAPDAVILAFGDSLTYGSGSAPDLENDAALSYPARLQGLIDRTVINAGVPGEMAIQGASRLPGLLARHKPALVILCHGGNDLLHAASLATLASSLRRMINECRATGVDVVLVGVPRPHVFLAVPELYEDLAEEFDLPLEREALVHILGDNALKSDLVHPNAKGYEVLARAVAALLIRQGALPPS